MKRFGWLTLCMAFSLFVSSESQKNELNKEGRTDPTQAQVKTKKDMINISPLVQKNDDTLSVQKSRRNKKKHSKYGRDWIEEDIRDLQLENRELRSHIRQLERAVMQLQMMVWDIADNQNDDRYNDRCEVNLEGRYGDGYLRMTSDDEFVFNWTNGRPQAYGYINGNCRGSFTFPDDRTYSIEATECRIYKDGRRSGNVWKKKHCRVRRHKG